jgi:hypothetical protein
VITDTLARIEISASEELALLRAARETVSFNGVSVPTASAQAAKEKLIAAYAGVINRAAHVPGLDWEEVEAELIEAFLRAIMEYDFQSNNRLNYEIKLRFTNAIARISAGRDALKIPTRTKALFYQILYKEAGGSWSDALDIVEHHPLMTHATFVAIGQAMQLGTVSDVTSSIWGQEPSKSNLEITQFVEWLLACLNERERVVIDLHYGFDAEDATKLRLAHGFGYDDVLEIPQIAALLNVHRQTAWRIHNSAIDKMREKINVTRG